MTGIMQVVMSKFPPPTTIGEVYGGGFYAGQIAVGGGGIATHYLIVAPKATGETRCTWGPAGATGYTSVIDGPTNSANEAALGAAYQAATFCENLTIGGYTDWYLPAKNELEVLYYNLKPSTVANNTSGGGYGANANAVSPEPISTNYTSGSPAQTSVVNFRITQSEQFAQNFYWCSSEYDATTVWTQMFFDGYQAPFNKGNTGTYTRAVRRIPI
jgi:hypothetical protein